MCAVLINLEINQNEILFQPFAYVSAHTTTIVLLNTIFALSCRVVALCFILCLSLKNACICEHICMKMIIVFFAHLTFFFKKEKVLCGRSNIIISNF